jgi:hypothetical protein
MTVSDLHELQRIAELSRHRAAAARDLAADRRRRAAHALAGRQFLYAQGLLDSACWLDAAADAEARRAEQLDGHGAVAPAGSAPQTRALRPAP